MSRRKALPAGRQAIWWELPLVRFGQGIVLLKITLLVVLFDPRVADSFALPKSIASHLTAVLLFGVLAALISVRPTTIPLREPMHIAALVVVLAFVIATVFALDQTTALFGTWRRYLGLTQMLDNGVLFLAVATLFRNRRLLGQLMIVALTCAALVATYTLVQRAGLDPIRYVQGVTPVATLGQPDILGGYLGIMGVTGIAAGALLLHMPLVFRTAALLAGSLSLVAAGTTGVRNTVLAVASGMAAAVILALLERGRQRRRALVILGIASLIGAFGVTLSPIAARLDPAHLMRDPAVLARFEFWHVGLNAVGARPLFGLGPDNFAVAYPSARYEESVALNGIGVLQTSPHDWLMYLLASGGLVAAAAALSLVTFAGIVAVQLARRSDSAAFAVVPLAAYLGQGVVDVNDVSIDWIWWVAVGVLAGSLRLRSAPVARRSSAGYAAVSLVLAGTLCVSVWLNAGARWMSSEAFAVSADFAARGQGLRAVEYARQAVALDSRRAENWGVFATALSVSGSASAAATAFLDAAQRSPWLPLYWRSAALQRLALGDEEQAKRLFHRAIEADPYDLESLNVLSRLSLNAGDPLTAAQYASRSLSIFPGDRDTLQVLTIADIRLARYGEAEDILMAAIRAGDDARLRVWLGQVYLSAGRKQEALEQALRALTLEPSLPEALSLRDAASR